MKRKEKKKTLADAAEQSEDENYVMLISLIALASTFEVSTNELLCLDSS